MMTTFEQMRSRSLWAKRIATVAAAVSCFWVVLHSAPTQAASGAWHSGITDGSGTWQMQGSQSDGTIAGTITATGTADFAQGSIYGTITATGELSFGVIYNDVEEATFVGSVSGGVASGTYTTVSGDSGTWIGSLNLQ
jgi:hypothetical protein